MTILKQVILSIEFPVCVTVFLPLVSHLLLIGFIVAFKPFSVMPLNPIKTTLNVSAQRKGGGCG